MKIAATAVIREQRSVFIKPSIGSLFSLSFQDGKQEGGKQENGKQERCLAAVAACAPSRLFMSGARLLTELFE